MRKVLQLTPELCTAIDVVRQAERAYTAGGVPGTVLELPKLALADALLAALRAQAVVPIVGPLERWPKPRPVRVHAARRSAKHRRRSA